MNYFPINLSRQLFKGLAVLILLLPFTSCKSVYTSGTYGAIKSYTPKPEYRDKDTSAVYVYGSYNDGNHKAGKVDDKKSIVAVGALQSFTRKHFNFHYGLGASYGSYNYRSSFITATLDSIKYGRKAFYTANTRAGINFNIPAKNVDWRVLGGELAYHYEFGPHQKTLKEIKNTVSNYLVYNQQSIFSYNFFTEVVFKQREDRVFSLGIFVGDILNKQEELKEQSSVFSGLFAAYRYRQFTLNFIAEAGREGIGSSQLGLSYQLF